MLLSRLLGKGKGSTLPGMIALKIYPGLLHSFSFQLRKGIIIVTGTNGKTTTNNMLAQILAGSGYKVLANLEGANLKKGVTAAFIKAAGLSGKINCDYAVLEVDEGAFPGVVSDIKPQAVVVTNFFRDQLDRYGELDTTIQVVSRALKNTEKVKLVLNADDPLVAQLCKKTGQAAFFYGIDFIETSITGVIEDTKEAKFCPFCGNNLKYNLYHYSQLGDYVCPGCEFRRPEPDINVSRVYKDGNYFYGSMYFDNNNINLSVPAGGVYNYYNALAAFAASVYLGIEPQVSAGVLYNYTSAIGRMDRFFYNDKPVLLNLVKNPTGFNQSLAALLAQERFQNLLIAINDNDADGRDISWLWDVNFEAIEEKENYFNNFICTGKRGEEMAVRLKYAGVSTNKITVEKSLEGAVSAALSQESEVTYLLVTYTALWQVDSILNKKAKRVGYSAESMPSVS
ncbi:MAG: MurT ligase domain-containing protein [Clostridiales bacterium]|nr:MurT ligase domain-containing protein [Clostridiales bacterium]MCF8022125.1 MurT ligase domain-containing protein [Clostridiales bacterium]